MEATKEARTGTATRIARLLYYYTRDYLNTLDEKAQEDAARKEMVEAYSSDGGTRVMICTAESNLKVALSCMRECVAAVDTLSHAEESVDDWMIAGIEAMIDKSNENNEFSFNLPTAICGVLGTEYRKRDENGKRE